MSRNWVLALCLTALAAASSSSSAEPQRALLHDVFFTLNDDSPAAREKLVAACHEYLKGHAGVVSFSVGTRAPEMTRDVNDREFGVSLHIAFKDAAAHAVYQEHPRHKQFIEKMKDNWKHVRVLDSWVSLP